MNFKFLQFLENAQRKWHLLVALHGTVGTLLVWWVHLTHPGTFPDPFLADRVNTARLIFVLGPPFLSVFCLGNIVLRQTSRIEKSGPMTGYLHQQESDRKWKITVAAGFAAAVNLLLMMVTTSGIS